MNDQLAHPEPTEPQAKAAFDVETRIKGRILQIRGGWIELAADLHAFAQSEMWRDLGWRSFEAWLASPEIELERRQVYYLLEMWRELVVKREVKPEQLVGLGVSKIQEVLPAVRRGFVDIDQALSDVATLARDDLRKQYSTSPNGSKPSSRSRIDDGSGVGGSLAPPAAAQGGFDAEAEPEWAVCQACGSRYPVKRS